MSSPIRPRNRRGQGDRLRSDIVAAATELLDETGDENAVTLRSVARRVGIAPPSIYQHFPDQPALVSAVVRQAFADLTARLCLAVTEVEDSSHKLRALCSSYVDYAWTFPHRYCAMFGHQELIAVEVTRLLTDTLVACVATGHSTSSDPAADATALWLGLHGLAHQRAVASTYPWPNDIADRMTFALARLTPPPTSARRQQP